MKCGVNSRKIQILLQSNTGFCFTNTVIKKVKKAEELYKVQIQLRYL